MADGAYERRGPREAELKRFQRIIAAAKKASEAVATTTPPARENGTLSDKGESR